MKHILESFTQIAISNPNISFKLINNGNNFYNLKKSNLKQRIITSILLIVSALLSILISEILFLVIVFVKFGNI